MKFSSFLQISNLKKFEFRKKKLRSSREKRNGGYLLIFTEVFSTASQPSSLGVAGGKSSSKASTKSEEPEEDKNDEEEDLFDDADEDVSSKNLNCKKL